MKTKCIWHWTFFWCRYFQKNDRKSPPPQSDRCELDNQLPLSTMSGFFCFQIVIYQHDQFNPSTRRDHCSLSVILHFNSSAAPFWKGHSDAGSPWNSQRVEAAFPRPVDCRLCLDGCQQQLPIFSSLETLPLLLLPARSNLVWALCQQDRRSLVGSSSATGSIFMLPRWATHRFLSGHHLASRLGKVTLCIFTQLTSSPSRWGPI